MAQSLCTETWFRGDGPYSRYGRRHLFDGALIHMDSWISMRFTGRMSSHDVCRADVLELRVIHRLSLGG